MTHKTQEITHHRDEVVGVHDRVNEAVENNRQEDVAVVPWAAQEKKQIKIRSRLKRSPSTSRAVEERQGRGGRHRRKGEGREECVCVHEYIKVHFRAANGDAYAHFRACFFGGVHVWVWVWVLVSPMLALSQ